MKPVNLIVARDECWGIGLDGKIPWRCRDDMLHFKKVTSSTVDSEKQNAVIMGRRTWESLKNKPLVDRVNICLSKSQQVIATCQTLQSAILTSNENPLVESIFIIGGERVYQESIQTLKIQTVWITIIKKEFPTDRDVRFLSGYLKDYKRTMIESTDEYSIWNYEIQPSQILPSFRS